MKNVLIVYSKGTAEILNRKSAIGSYIFNLANLLHAANTSIFINGTRLNDLSIDQNNEQTIRTSGSWKKYIPSFIKSYVREKAILKQARTTAANIGREKIQFSHVIEFYTIGSTVGKTLASLQKCPLTVVYDNPVLEEYEFFNKKAFLASAFENAERETLYAAKNIVTYSKPVGDYLGQKYTGLKARFLTHQNIDFSRFRFIDSKPETGSCLNVCFVGSFLKWHNTEMLVCEFDNLCRIFPEIDMHLYMIGDGMMRKSCEELTLKLGNKRIHFTGFLDGQELFDLQKKMHIGIMPGSNWYGAPNKLFEYGAMKMAVIAPSTPTITYLFAQDDMIFFQMNDAMSFNNALKSVITDRKKIDTLSTQLHTKIRNNYSAEKTQHFYRNILDL